VESTGKLPANAIKLESLVRKGSDGRYRWVGLLRFWRFFAGVLTSMIDA